MNITESNIFKIAFIISIITHLFVISPWQKFFVNKKETKKEFHKLNIIYTPSEFKDKQLPNKGKIDVTAIKNKDTVSKTEKEESGKESNDKSIKKSLTEENKQKQLKITPKKKTSISKEEFNVEDETDIKKKENSPIGIEQVPEKERPAFIEYYRFIRNKIEVIAQNNRPEYFKEGEVNVIFKLNSRGKLLSVTINEDMSTSDRVLRFFAIESIRRASPFPPFPEGLTAEELEFRITIEFHI